MPVFTCVMSALAIALFIAGALLCAGQYGWLRSFRWSSHKDNKAYARYLGKSTIGLGAIMLASGLAHLQLGTVPGVVLLIGGIAIAFVVITKGAGKHYR